MSTVGIVALLVVIAILVAGGIVFGLPQLRSQRLKRTFGPEYDYTVGKHGDRRAAERELQERQSRHAQYELRPLSPESRAKYQESWQRIQEQFVESPTESVAQAERLVNSLVADLGYPSEGHERQLADLSVRHGHAVKEYRDAHEARMRDGADTDDLRSSLLGYRNLFRDLLDSGPKSGGPRTNGQAAYEHDDDKAVRQG